VVIGKEKAENLLHDALAMAKGDEAEVVVLGEDGSLTRFANSQVHQNQADRRVSIHFRSIVNGNEGRASASGYRIQAMRRAAEQAYRNACLAGDGSLPRVLPDPVPVPPSVDIDQDIATRTPQERARDLGIVFRLAEESDGTAAGAYMLATMEVGVANTRGVMCYAPSSVASLTTVMRVGERTGYAEMNGRQLEDVVPEKVAREALDTCRALPIVDIEPGEYQVLLREYAVAEMIGYLAEMAFTAPSIEEGYSFVADKLGQKVMGTNISFWDDGLDRSGLARSFDYEGVPKRKVEFITRGVARKVVHDTQSARKADTASTGHAAPPNPEYLKPMPGNVFMAAGSSSPGRMMGKISRGLLVTRLDYIRVVHPLKTMITGMTRDGLFLVEGGQVMARARNLRFTQSIAEALNRVKALSADRRLVLGREGFGFDATAMVVPMLLVDGFNFTGQTTF